MERVAVENMMRILLMASGEGQRSNEGFRSSVGDLDVASPDATRAANFDLSKHFHVESLPLQDPAGMCEIHLSFYILQMPVQAFSTHSSSRVARRPLPPPPRRQRPLILNSTKMTHIHPSSVSPSPQPQPPRRRQTMKSIITTNALVFFTATALLLTLGTNPRTMTMVYTSMFVAISNL